MWGLLWIYSAGLYVILLNIILYMLRNHPLTFLKGSETCKLMKKFQLKMENWMMRYKLPIDYLLFNSLPGLSIWTSGKIDMLSRAAGNSKYAPVVVDNQLEKFREGPCHFIKWDYLTLKVDHKYDSLYAGLSRMCKTDLHLEFFSY